MGKLQIGSWILDEELGSLSKQGVEIQLEPLQYTFLKRLMKEPFEVVNKETLAEEVWQNDMVSDQTISVTVHTLRRIFGDDAKNPQYIQTLPRKGYRFLQKPKAPTQIAIPMVLRNWRRGIPLALFAIVALFMGVRFGAKPAPQENKIRSLKLNVVGDSNLSDLFKSEAGKQLETWVKNEEGSQVLSCVFEGEAESLNALVSLRDPISAQDLWSFSLNVGIWSEPFFVHKLIQEIGRRVDPDFESDSFQEKLSEDQESQFYSLTKSEKPWPQKAAQLEVLLVGNENHLPLRLATANAYLMAALWGRMPRDQAYFRCRDHIEKAELMAPRSKELWLLKGNLKLFFEWNQQEARYWFQKANHENQAFHSGFFGPILLEAMVGNFESAATMVNQAQKLEPQSKFWKMLDFDLDYYQLHPTKALEKMSQVEPFFNRATLLMRAYPLHLARQEFSELRKIESALLQELGLEEALKQYMTAPNPKSFCYESIATFMVEKRKTKFISDIDVAIFYAYAEKPTQVFEHLNNAMLDKDPKLPIGLMFPAFEPYKKDPRFIAIREKVQNYKQKWNSEKPEGQSLSLGQR